MIKMSGSRDWEWRTFISIDEAKERLFGSVGTPRRDAYEEEVSKELAALFKNQSKNNASE